MLYGAYDWLPQRVKVLAIGESPPPSRKKSFFYNLNAFDRLRLSLRLVTGLDGRDLLLALKKRGVFITSAVKCRPLSFKLIPAMRKECVAVLREEIESLKPSRIVAMGRTAVLSVCEVFDLPVPSRVNGIFRLGEKPDLFVTPHPNYIFRFRRDLAPELGKLLGFL